MPKRRAKYEVFPTVHLNPHRELWYWRLKAGNGRITSIGAEPFPSQLHAIRAIRRNEKTMSTAVIRVFKR